MKTKNNSLTAGGFAHPEISQEPILIQHRTEPRILSHSERGELTPFAKGDFSHLSKWANYPHWQDLSASFSYSQKKKDSVQAVLIQLYPLEQVTRLPNNIGLPQRLPDYIGLVQYFLSSIGGWDLNRINNIYSVQHHSLVNDVHSVDCLVLRCLRLISPCRAVMMNCAVLSPSLLFSSIASTIGCGTRTSIRFDFEFIDFVAIAGLLCYWCPTMIYKKKCNSRVDLSHTLLIVCVPHLEVFKVQNSETPQCWSTNGASNHNVKRGNTMAMYKSTQTHPKFLWRFFSCQQFKYFSVEASNEQEARSMLPDSPCLFSARIRQGGA